MSDATPLADLDALLASMRPVLRPGVYAFCALPPGASTEALDRIGRQCIGMFREDEGTTVIVPEDAAIAAGLPVLFRAAWLTLQVHSDLHAVGFTAAFATALAREGIGCNVIAAARHDHVFVAADDGARALEVLQALQRGVR